MSQPASASSTICSISSPGHSRIDITVKANGDLHVDHHHTTEDVGIALGQAVKQALGNMAGITRYASIHMPMDETLSRVVIDISGRPVLVFKAEFPRDKVGQFDTELVREWFNAFAMNAGVTLHVETLYGENSHHIAESCFKGLARALRTAVAIDPRAAGEVPSTKGRSGVPRSESAFPGGERQCRSIRFTLPRPMARIFGATDKFVFVRDGFHFWAMIFGPLWLLWNRLWLATVGWIVRSIALEISAGKPSRGAARCFCQRRSRRHPDGARGLEPAALDLVAAPLASARRGRRR